MAPLSLKSKITLGAISIIGLVLGVSLYLTMEAQRRQLLELAKKKGELVTETIQRSTAHEMEEGKTESVQMMLELVGSHPDFIAVRIIDTKGFVLRSANVKEIGKTLEAHDLAAFLRGQPSQILTKGKGGSRALSILRPIPNRPQCHSCHDRNEKTLGVLQVQVSLGETERQITSNRNTLVGITLLALLLANVAIGVMFTRIVNRPMEVLTGTMDRVEKGDLTARANIHSRDELGQLARSFNSMIERIDAAQREIQRHHEAEMQRADRLAALGKLASGVVHEINNPLSGMRNCVRTLLKGSKDQRLKTQYLSLLQDGLGRIEKIVKQLLNFSQRVEPQMRPTDVNSFLKKSLELLNFDLSNKGIRVIPTLDPHLDPVSADPDQLEQVFLNLMINAVEAMSKGGELRVRTERRAGWVVIEIRDTGSGIPPENIDRVFDPFFTTKGVGEGTGLGLSVSYGIIQRHGGTIGVESQVGTGSTFSIKLPIRSDPSIH